jgi:hypothetical protein
MVLQPRAADHSEEMIRSLRLVTTLDSWASAHTSFTGTN